MLAQVLFPSGTTVDTAAFAMSVAPPYDSVVGLESSDGASFVEVFQTTDWSVGTERGAVGFVCVPFVCTVAAPRPLPPRARSLLPRPRPPRPLSAPLRAARGALPESVWMFAAVSLTLDFDRSFLGFDTSPHCVIVPNQHVSISVQNHPNRGMKISSPSEVDGHRVTYHQ